MGEEAQSCGWRIYRVDCQWDVGYVLHRVFAASDEMNTAAVTGMTRAASGRLATRSEFELPGVEEGGQATKELITRVVCVLIVLEFMYIGEQGAQA